MVTTVRALVTAPLSLLLSRFLGARGGIGVGELMIFEAMLVEEILLTPVLAVL